MKNDSFQKQDSGVDAEESVADLTTAAYSWTYSSTKKALSRVKGSLFYAAGICLIVAILIFTPNRSYDSVYSATSSICRFGRSPILNVRPCKVEVLSLSAYDRPPPHHIDKFTAFYSELEDVFNASADGISIPCDLKRGESTIRDLRSVVQYSSLQYRNQLDLELEGLIATTHATVIYLKRFHWHVDGTAKHLLVASRMMKRTLGDISVDETSKGAIASFFARKDKDFMKQTLQDLYIQHTDIAEKEVQRLIAEAKSILFGLASIENRLNFIHDIVVLYEVDTIDSMEEVLGQLWTMLIGNELGSDQIDKARLLSQVNVYHNNAELHVNKILIKLQKMEMTIGLGAVSLSGEVPLIVQSKNIASVIKSLEKLKYGLRDVC